MAKKFKLLKDIPWGKAWDILPTEFSIWTKWIAEEYAKKYPDFFEPIEEKLSYDTLTKEDKVWFIDYNWEIYCGDEFTSECCRSETFVSKQSAEDEHKRREWANRKDKFFPQEWEKYWYPDTDGRPSFTFYYSSQTLDILRANSWLCFRTGEKCEDAIKNSDIVRLFYTIR